MFKSNENYLIHNNNQYINNTITHSFLLVQYEHFVNLASNNQQIQDKLSNDQQIQHILQQHFDLPSWIAAKINSYSHGLIQTYKTCIKLSDQQEQIICIIKEKTNQQLKNSIIILKYHPKTMDNNRHKSDSIHPLQNKSNTYQLYFLSNDDDDDQLNHILLNQPIHNNSSLYKLLKQPIGTLTIQFQSHSIQHIDQNTNYPPKRSHIQMKVIQPINQTNNKSYKNSLLQTIFQTYHVPFKQIFYANPNTNAKPFTANSYLMLQQTDSVPYRTLKFNNNNDKRNDEQYNKRYTFIFRKFQKHSTLQQLRSIAHQYTEQVFNKITKEKQTQSITNKYIEDNIFPDNHFICLASNSFILFLISLSPILKKQQIINYLNQYMDINHPSYQSFFNTKKGTFYINDKKVQQIKKSLNLLLSKLILQYSKQISALASQLSFVFQIFQLINQSIFTKEFIQKLFQLFLLYGGLYPQILLSAQDWIHDLSYNDGNGQKIGNTKNYQKQNQKYSLNDMISAGKMTRLKSKLNPLLIQILQDIKAIKNDKLTFHEHFLLTKNAFTITAFDLTSKTVRFFNHVTTPQLNILDFLYMSHNFQCIQIPNQWSPYKISYQNQTIFINLSQHLITTPIGVKYLQQFTDNIEVCKRYFPFLIETQKQLQFGKFILNGNKINSKQVYQQRQKQSVLKHHEIISSLKRLIFSNIPKTKLIWRFIKFQVSSKQTTNQKSQTMISILRKIQIVNHLYNLVKTLTSHEKNLCRQVWLQNQCNFIDSVKSTKNNFIEEGQQKGIMKWEIERIKHLKKTIKTLKFKEKFKNTQKMQNYQNQSNLVKVWLNILKQNLLNRVTNQYNFQDVLSETDKIKAMQQIKQNLSGILYSLKKLQQSFTKNQYFQKLLYICQQGVKNVNQWSEKFYSNKEPFSIRKMNKFIDQQLLSKIQKICISNIKVFAQLINQINLKEIEKILQEVDKYLLFVQSHQKVILNKTIEAKPIWFNIQLEYQTFIKKLFNLLNSSITIQAKSTLIRIYNEYGVKQFQIYDEFYSNFILIDKKIDYNLKDHRLQKIHKDLLTRNKINLVIDCQENSQLFTSLYLKLLFMKLNKIQSTKDTQLNNSDSKVKANDFFRNQKVQLKESNFRFQKYFQSFTCSGFTSIAILELIQQNNFRNNSTKKDFEMNQILSKIISYRHLFQWKNSQQIGNVFDSFQWHILQQQRSQQFYESVYTQEYLKQLYSRTQFSTDQIKQKFNQFHQKLKSQQKSKIKNQSKSPFLNKRKQIQLYLFYQILEQWSQMVAKRQENNQNLQQNTQKLSIDELIDLKILYNQKVNQTYSTLQKKQLITMFKKFMGKFGPFFEEIISVSLDNNPHSKQQWKAILLKNAISNFKLKNYLQNLFQSYNLSPNVTFQELYRLGANKFQGQFNIILWNVTKSCIQVCNYITKPKMPVWFAILSSCSLPFYMQEQLSHKKWQISQFSKIYPNFRQFPNRSKQAFHFQQTQINRKSSQRQSLNKTQNSKVYKQLLSSTIPDLIDQQCNKYLSPSIIQAFPLNYLRNPYFGMIRKQNAKIMIIVFRKNDSGLSDRIRNNIFQQSQINVNISNVLGLYFNKKDKNVRILRQYLRKKLKQTHFYSFFKTVINKNENLFQNYKKAEKQSKNSEPSQQTRKFSYDMTSFDQKTRTIKLDGSDKENNQMNFYKQKKCLNVKLSKIQIQKVQCVSQEAKNDLNSKICHNSYKFFTTFSEINRQKQVQLPQLTSKQLMVDLQDRIQSPTLQVIRAKSKKQNSHSQRKQLKSKPKQRRIKKFFKKYIVNCKCFGFRPTNRQKQLYKKNQN